MGIFDIFKMKKDNKKKSTRSLNKQHGISIRSNFLDIKSINFYGIYKTSANNDYIVGCQDFDYKGGSRGGSRNKGYGRCVLVKDNKILYQLDIERPNDPSVSNNGIVALNDWKFNEKLAGTFFVINSNGKKLIEHHTKANLHHCNISDDGKIAWCTTLDNIKNETDSSKLMVFSITPPVIVLKLQIAPGPIKVELKKNNIFVTLEQGIYHYDLNGNLLNPEQVTKQERDHKIKDSNGYDLYHLAVEMNKEYSGEKIMPDQVITDISVLLDKAVKKGMSDYYMAKSHRMLGECAEMINDKHEALKHYRLAIKSDPKVGCKRNLTKLERELG